MPGVTAGECGEQCCNGHQEWSWASRQATQVNQRPSEHGWTRVKHSLREDGGDLHWHQPGLINHISEITRGYIIAYYT